MWTKAALTYQLCPYHRSFSVKSLIKLCEHGYKNIRVAACISEVNLPLEVHHLVHQKTCRGILQFQCDAQICAA